MDFSNLILEFLIKEGSVSVPNFGKFSLKKTNAFVDKNGENIIPPGEEVVFSNEIKGKDMAFIRFISTQNKITELEAEIEITKQVNSWNSYLEKNGQLTLENLGDFKFNDGVKSFSNTGKENVSPDFYGLEEINISKIKHQKSKIDQASVDHNYAFSKSLFWIIPLIMGILALTYFGIAQPEKMFGRKSFKNDLKGEPLKKTKAVPLKKDSLAKDSINMMSDSMKIIPVKPASINNKISTKK